MTVARWLAEFLTQVSYADLPPQTVEHAAMLIASTIASAAWGSGIASSGIIRTLARETAGRPKLRSGLIVPSCRWLRLHGSTRS